MRRLAPVLLILFLTCSLAACGRGPSSGGSDFDLAPTRYAISASLIPEEKVLSVETEVTCSAPTSDLAAVKLYLYGNVYREGNVVVTEDKIAATYPHGKVDHGGAEVLEVTADGAPASYDLGQGGTVLTLRLGRKYAKGEEIRLRIATRVTLANCRHRLGYADGYYLLSDFYPVLCPFREGKYLVREYLPYGDPFLQDTADFDLDLTIPVGYECAAGTFEQRRERQGTTERRFYTFEGARDLALVCSQKLRYAQTEAGDTPIRYYYESDKNIRNTLAHVQSAMEEYVADFGAYPYPTYTVVTAPFFEAGVEHSGLAVVSSSLSETDRAMTILHETAHQWWYGKVGNDGYLAPWMDEGLAEYAVALFYEHAGSKRAYRAKLSEAEDAFSIRYALKGAEGVRFDLPLSELRDGYYDRVYCGGLLLFATVAERVGEERFLSALRRYAACFDGRVASPKDMTDCLSEALGEDLSALFSAWLTGGIPID